MQNKSQFPDLKTGVCYDIAGLTSCGLFLGYTCCLNNPYIPRKPINAVSYINPKCINIAVFYDMQPKAWAPKILTIELMPVQYFKKVGKEYPDYKQNLQIRHDLNEWMSGRMIKRLYETEPVHNKLSHFKIFEDTEDMREITDVQEFQKWDDAVISVSPEGDYVFIMYKLMSNPNRFRIYYQEELVDSNRIIFYPPNIFMNISDIVQGFPSYKFYTCNRPKFLIEDTYGNMFLQKP